MLWLLLNNFVYFRFIQIKRFKKEKIKWQNVLYLMRKQEKPC